MKQVDDCCDLARSNNEMKTTFCASGKTSHRAGCNFKLLAKSAANEAAERERERGKHEPHEGGRASLAERTRERERGRVDEILRDGRAHFSMTGSRNERARVSDTGLGGREREAS